MKDPMTPTLDSILEEMENSALGRHELSECSTEKALIEYVDDDFTVIKKLIKALRLAVEQRDVWAMNEQADVSMFANQEIIDCLTGGEK